MQQKLLAEANAAKEAAKIAANAAFEKMQAEIRAREAMSVK